MKLIIIYLVALIGVFAADKPAPRVLSDRDKYELAMAIMDANDAVYAANTATQAANEKNKVATDKSQIAHDLLVKKCGADYDLAKDNKGEFVCQTPPTPTAPAKQPTPPK